MPLQVQKVDELIDDAVRRGAKILLGGKSTGGKCLVHEPTILAEIPADARILHEEIFGPVMCLIPFDNEEELVQQANNVEFGLCCSIISGSTSRAERLARRIDSGMCVINEFGVAFLAQDAPFGGVKASGFGCFNGPEGLRGFCHAHVIHSEKFWMPASMKVPPMLAYPWMDITPTVVKHMTEILYGWGLGTKAAATLKLIKTFISGKP
jgi:acyl-CoA reductase-like NAD-dependent aldehyde dehydrogenase